MSVAEGKSAPRRYRLSLGRVALVVCLLLFWLLATLPLALGVSLFRLDDRGVSARSASGSVWAGQLEDARLGGLPLGSSRVRLSPSRLLIGEVELTLDGADAGTVSGILSTGRSHFSVTGMNGVISLSSLLPGEMGMVTLTDINARFADGQCVEAAGTIMVDRLGQTVPLQCEAGMARARFGALGALNIDVNGRVTVTGA
ncbi:MAG: type II secretion system protein N [Pacificimonas sp.]